MDTLQTCREQIDSIDNQLVKLLEERFKYCLSIGQYKLENNLDILNEEREKQVVEKNLKLVNDDTYKPFIKHVLESIMAESRNIQSNIKSFPRG